MITMLTVLLYLGLIVEHRTAVEAGLLPKPIIWAEPGSVIAMYKPVIIWCQGSWETQEYSLHKERSVNTWDNQFPLETTNKAKFNIEFMTETYADIYKCSYKSAAGFSEHSDAMELVMTGAYENPSLSVWPSLDVTSGVSIAFKCSSSLGFGRFILIQEGKYNLSWTLDSKQNDSHSFYATFVLDAVTPNHNGTFRCYGYFRNEPQVWSKSSNPLDLMVSETKDLSSTPIEDGLETYQKILTGVLVSFLLLFFLLLLLILFRYWCSCKKKKASQREANFQMLSGAPDPTHRDRLHQKSSSPDATINEKHLYASVKNTQSEDNTELNSWNPPDEDPQGIVYAQVKPSRLRKDTASKETQVVTYAQLCSKT
ncbi:leukocyte immunoglobulin-like receptor subfamily B member 4 [Grammomys surdaster]|uniref:leukocyte immunoglobulin-like receptor subfamily B member 4 n=1 Tax=Grammomys surdaster TaxID=491861 RepID=UPI00109F0E30|nr:leukocyte immunoglobulin-like receptor subfamily B member 4 [Grammomys surdaster]